MKWNRACCYALTQWPGTQLDFSCCSYRTVSQPYMFVKPFIIKSIHHPLHLFINTVGAIAAKSETKINRKLSKLVAEESWSNWSTGKLLRPQRSFFQIFTWKSRQQQIDGNTFKCSFFFLRKIHRTARYVNFSLCNHSYESVRAKTI